MSTDASSPENPARVGTYAVELRANPRHRLLQRCLVRPQDGPPSGAEERALPLGRKLWITATGLVPASLLIAAVLGSIFAGIASPTEAAAVGALGAALLAACYGKLTVALVRLSMSTATRWRKRILSKSASLAR